MKIFLSRSFPGEAMERLKQEFEVDQNKGWLPLPREQFKSRVKDADIILTYSDVVDAEIMDSAPNLKLIVDHWGGRRNVDREAAEKRGIKVADMPNSYIWIIDGVADIVWGLMIALGRRFLEADQFIRDGKFTHSEQSNHLLLGEGLSGRTVGILGAGRIGCAVAKRAEGFNVKLIYYDTHNVEEVEKYGAVLVDKETFFKTSDYITVHLSDIDENKHFVGENEFRLMKKTAYIINTARGRIIDEKAMVKALREGLIAGAGLDVYEFEPNVSKEFMSMKNVLLLPHIGGALYKEREYIFSCMVNACLDFKNRT